MIDENTTFALFGYYSSELKPQSAKPIIADCDICGKVREIRMTDYRNLCRKCGSININRKYYIKPGARFGRWKVLCEDDHRVNKCIVYNCICDCGTIKKVKGLNLRNGKSKSCGCLNKEIISQILTGKKHSMKSKILMSAIQQGIALDEWEGFFRNGERTLYNSQEYKKWRASVFKRDNYTCQMCGQYGGNLNGHHIYKISNYPELIFEANNGITLCKDCHVHKVNQHEEEYEIEFISKIFDNKGIEIFGGDF